MGAWETHTPKKEKRRTGLTGQRKKKKKGKVSPNDVTKRLAD